MDKHEILEALEKTIQQEYREEYEDSEECEAKLQEIYNKSLNDMYVALSTSRGSLGVYVNIENSSGGAALNKVIGLNSLIVSEAKEVNDKSYKNYIVDELKAIIKEIEGL